MASLARHLGDDTGDLTAPGESTARHPLAVSCPDGTHYGSVTTWLTGTRGASLACGADPGGEAWVREACRLACGPLSR